MAPVSNPIDDAASEALIARLIAEDFGENIDSLRIGGSVEDYEEPMSSYERGLADGTINGNEVSWGDPISNQGASGSSSPRTITPYHTGEGWDSSAAWDETPLNDTTEHGREEQQHYESATQYVPDTEWCIMSQTSLSPALGLSSVFNQEQSNVSSPHTLLQHTFSDVFPGSSTPPTSHTAMPDTVPSSPILAPQRETFDDFHLETNGNPSPLLLDAPSSPIQLPVPNIQSIASDHSRSQIDAVLESSKPVLPVRLSEEEAIGQAVIWPRPTRRYSSSQLTKWNVPRFSAADRYAGLDIDYSSSKGKGKARAFDGFNLNDSDDHGSENDYEGIDRLREKFISILHRNDRNRDDIPWIYIPFPGFVCGRDEEEIRRLEDQAVVEIHIGEDETLESILRDICDATDLEARERLEASVSSAASSTTGTHGSTNPTSVEPSATSDDRTPKMRSLRQMRRFAYERRRRKWMPKKHDEALLHRTQVRGETEVLKGAPPAEVTKGGEGAAEAPRGRTTERGGEKGTGIGGRASAETAQSGERLGDRIGNEMIG